MARVHGSNSTISVGAQTLSVYCNEAKLSSSRDASEVTGFGDDSRKYIAGLRDAKLSISGSYDVALNGPEDVLAEGIETGSELAVDLNPGNGGTNYTGNAIVVAWEVSSNLSDAVMFSAELQFSGDVTRA